MVKNRTDIGIKIGKTVKALRVNTGLTQGELSEKLNFSQAQLSDIENGKTIPGIDKIIAMADFFNVSVAVIDKRLKNVAAPGRDELRILKEHKDGLTLKMLEFWDKLSDSSRLEVLAYMNRLLSDPQNINYQVNEKDDDYTMAAESNDV